MGAGERHRSADTGHPLPAGLQVPVEGHPYADFLARLHKPARYVGGEVGAVRKDWSATPVRVCLAFPDVYEVGMSHLGLRILYGLLNADPHSLAERCYCPWPDLEAELRDRRLPLVSLESFRPLAEFDVVGFSLQFELTYTNVLTMLELGGIPLRAADRRETDPLVVGGGPNTTHPEPVADFFDAFVIGDGERLITGLVASWTEGRAAGLSRRQRLRRLAELGSVYVPALYETRPASDGGAWVVTGPAEQGVPHPVGRATVALQEYPFPADGPAGGPEAIFDRTSVEIARGCFEGCRFCQAGMTNRPVRERAPRQIIHTARAAVRHTGSDEVALTALSPADVSFVHPLIRHLAGSLAAEGVGLGISSLRAYGLEPELLDELKRMRAAGLTFAPEAGTQRLRDVINKNVSEAELRAATVQVLSRGWTRLKLYFMIGLPTETADDVRGIVETAVRTAQAGRAVAGRRARITVSVSTHVPKPHTPFQWCAMDSPAEIRRKQALLRDEIRPHRGLQLRLHNPDASRLEGVLARGDRRMSRVIEEAWRAGARFDSWDEHLRLDCWSAAFAAVKLDPDAFLQAVEPAARLPWDHLDTGVERSFLEREYRRALRAKPSPPCGRLAPQKAARPAGQAEEQRPLVCHHCGVECDLDELVRQRHDHLEELHAALSAARPSAGRGAATHTGEGGPAQIGTPRGGQRYRLRYEKTGAAALLGHLDVVRELGRVLRRAGVDMVYTAGFHPKPAMAFAPALALGVVSLDEYVDVRLCAELDGPSQAALLGRMNEVSPVGLRFLEIERLAEGESAVTKRITAARYGLVIARTVLEQWLRGGPDRGKHPCDWLAARCEWLLDQSVIELRRTRHAKLRSVDIRPFVLAAGLAEPEELAAVRRAGWAGEVVMARVDVALGPAGSAKPAELARALLGPSPPTHGLVRLALLTGSPAALEPLGRSNGAGSSCDGTDPPI